MSTFSSSGSIIALAEAASLTQSRVAQCRCDGLDTLCLRANGGGFRPRPGPKRHLAAWGFRLGETAAFVARTSASSSSSLCSFLCFKLLFLIHLQQDVPV